jgi:hypothetical protein
MEHVMKIFKENTHEKNATKITKALRGTLGYTNIPKEVKEHIFHGTVLSYGGKM